MIVALMNGRLAMWITLMQIVFEVVTSSEGETVNLTDVSVFRSSHSMYLQFDLWTFITH